MTPGAKRGKRLRTNSPRDRVCWDGDRATWVQPPFAIMLITLTTDRRGSQFVANCCGTDNCNAGLGLGMISRLFAALVDNQSSPANATFRWFNSDAVVHCVLQSLSAHNTVPSSVRLHGQVKTGSVPAHRPQRDRDGHRCGADHAAPALRFLLWQRIPSLQTRQLFRLLRSPRLSRSYSRSGRLAHWKYWRPPSTRPVQI